MRTLLAVLLATAPMAARAETPLTVLAAASLKAPLEASAPEFEKAHPGVKIVISAAATGVLVKQVEAGAPADVLLSADRPSAEHLVAAKLGTTLTTFARNTLVLAAPANSTTSVAKLSELRAPAIKRIGIGKPETVPAGRYAKDALTRAGLYDELAPRFVFGESVTQVLSYLRSGDVDVGFVYASDAASTHGEVRVLLNVDASVEYDGVALVSSKHPALVKAYLEFLMSEPAQRALHDAGFQK